MNVVIADTTFGLNITNTAAANYGSGNVTLPAGTYFVRASAITLTVARPHGRLR